MKHEIALSFAGEDRAYVEMVARFLKAHDASFFYDDYSVVDLWGKDLYSHLADVYSKADRYVVMFVSQHYAAKVWTNHERRAAQSRALTERGEYILPVRFDDTAIDGLLPTIGFLDARRLSPELVASRILEKLGRPVILAKANTVPPPHSSALSGQVSFHYSSHDGRVQIGDGALLFEPRWSRAGDTSIHCYNDSPLIRGIALAPLGSDFGALSDVSSLDFTSRTRTPRIGQFVVLQNLRGFFALLRVDGINVGIHGATADELRLSYWIRRDGGSDFSGESG
jgi:hypothetical protein